MTLYPAAAKLPADLCHPVLPDVVGAAAERAIAVRGRRRRLERILERSPVPMVVVDRERRHVEANPAARLVFRLKLDELRRLRIDDLTPSQLLMQLRGAWGRMLEVGCVAGCHELAGPDGSRLPVVYCGVAEIMPGLHLIAFAPAGWSDGELVGELQEADSAAMPLTPRELEVLELSADGRTGPMIARELVITTATVRTHFDHIYTKLGVSDRAAAVARAMRLGLIA